MNTLRLRFPGGERHDLVLGPGVHAIGRDRDGAPHLVADAASALAQLGIDRRGVWLQVRDGIRGLHVNGRPVRRMAMLRAGDSIYLEGVELLLLGPEPQPAPDTATDAAPQDARMVLRGIGGQHHGRSVPLDRPRMIGRLRECDVCIDEPALAERHARLEPHADGVVLRDLGSEEGSLVNGHRVRHALLQPGDQLVFDAQRFVIEAPSRSATAAAEADPPAVVPAITAPLAPGVRASVRRIPWLLLAALLLSGALSLLLLYGVR